MTRLCDICKVEHDVLGDGKAVICWWDFQGHIYRIPDLKEDDVPLRLCEFFTYKGDRDAEAGVAEG